MDGEMAVILAHVDLLAILAFLSGHLFLAAPKIYEWNRNACFSYLPWYRRPAPGSFRAWVERPRPKLKRVCANALTAILLFAACELFVVLAIVVERVLLI